MIRKMQTGGASNYEQMLAQLYGNIGSCWSSLYSKYS